MAQVIALASQVDQDMSHPRAQEADKNAPENRVTYPIPDSLKEKFSGFYEFKSPKSDLLGFSERPPVNSNSPKQP